MLQDACGVIVVHEVRVGIRLEMRHNILNLLHEGTALDICVSDGTEALPQGKNDYLCLGVFAMDFVDQLDVRGAELGGGHVVRRVGVVCAW